MYDRLGLERPVSKDVIEAQNMYSEKSNNVSSDGNDGNLIVVPRPDTKSTDTDVPLPPVKEVIEESIKEAGEVRVFHRPHPRPDTDKDAVNSIRKWFERLVPELLIVQPL